MLRTLTAALACLACCAAGLAQTDAAAPAQPGGHAGAGAPTGAPQNGAGQGEAGGKPVPRLEDLPPAVRLGVRAQAVRGGWPTLSTVVIVPDEASYAAAIAAWTMQARYPVLIDDGTQAAREDIARFVRAFKPATVVRWSAAEAWPADGAERQARIEAALFRAWSGRLPREEAEPKVGSQEELIARWVRIGAAPPGVVVADAADPAWPAALALAAGRCQPIAWVKAPGNVNATMTAAEAESLEVAVQSACERLGVPWRELGDAIDAVTLCVNAPAKVAAADGGVIALTDLLGRLAGEGGSRVKGARWAWSGQVFGGGARAAYAAMSALFTVPERAWLFDGYRDEKPWSAYDATAAAPPLRQMKLDVTVDDAPSQGERAWRLRSSLGVDAGLITVNTHGGADEFNLEPGRCRPGDIPFLDVPAMVYFVHSYSAAVPGERATVAGRWLERGAYAYLGSVQEPFLHAFVPTPAVAARLAGGFPWGAAVRFDGKTDAWKLATFGDPLATLGRAPPRAGSDLPLAGATDVQEEMRRATTEGRFEEAVSLLTVLGRDKDAARLAAALLRDDPAKFAPAVAAASILPLLRAHDAATLVRAYGMLPADLASDPVRRDALWHACYTLMGSSLDEASLAVLMTNLRPDQVGRDAAELARSVVRLHGAGGRDAAAGMLAEARRASTTDEDRNRVDEAIKSLNLIPVGQK